MEEGGRELHLGVLDAHFVSEFLVPEYDLPSAHFAIVWRGAEGLRGREEVQSLLRQHLACEWCRMVGAPLILWPDALIESEKAFIW